MKWTDHEAASVILSRVSTLIHVLKDKSLSWHSYLVDDAPALLSELLTFPDGWGEHDRFEITRAALLEAAKNRELDPNGLLRAARQELSRLNRQKAKRFVVLTSLSLQHFEGLGRIQHEGSVLTFSAGAPARFRRPESAKRAAESIVYGPIPESYCTVRVSVSGTSPYSAFDTALNRLDLVRGLWNLFLNGPKGRRFSSGRLRPVNDLVLGPIHSLHESNGAPAVPFHWWEPGYVEPLATRDVQSEYRPMRKFDRFARNTIRRHTLRTRVENGVVRYVRALDERDPTTAFLKVWGVIEYLTGTTNKPYEVTCRRAAFLFQDREYHYSVLKTLRIRRNRIVHVGEESDRMERVLYQSKRYAEELIMVLLDHPREFESMDDFGTYLDLPTERHRIRKRQRRIEMAAGLRRTPESV